MKKTKTAMDESCDWDAATRITACVEQDPKLAVQVNWLRRSPGASSGFMLTDPPAGLRPKLEALFDMHQKKA